MLSQVRKNKTYWLNKEQVWATVVDVKEDPGHFFGKIVTYVDSDRQLHRTQYKYFRENAS